MAENLTQQALRDRDGLIKSFDSARMPGSSFSRMTTRIGISAAKQDLAERKFQFEQDKAAQEAALRQQQADRRADEAVAKAEHLQRIADIKQAQTDLAAQTAKMNDAVAQARIAELQANTAKTIAQADHTKEVASAAVRIYEGMSKLNRSSPTFVPELFQLLSKNAAAAEHPEVAKAIQYQVETNDKERKLQAQEQVAKSGGMVPDKIVAGGVTYEKPKAIDDPKQKELETLRKLRMNPKLEERGPDIKNFREPARPGPFLHQDQIDYLDSKIREIEGPKQTLSDAKPLTPTTPVVPVAQSTAEIPESGTVQAEKRPISQQEYDALPEGSEFTHNGVRGIKPKKSLSE